jgi:outer membrane protein, heavy metal efflux system
MCRTAATVSTHVRSPRIRWAAAGALVAALTATPAGSQVGEGTPEPAGGLHLSEVLAVAEARSPMLAAFRSAAAAAAAREPEASTLPDPMLQLGIMNFSVPDLSTDMPTSMAPSVQLMQMLPFPGKLGLKGDIAEKSSAMATATTREAEWLVRREAASLFFDLYALDRRLEVMRETLGLLKDFAEVARAMYGAGTGRQADVLRASVEIARMDAEIRRMEAMRVAYAAELNAALDRPATTPVPSPVLDDLPADVPGREILLAWARESRPVLERSRLAVEQAQMRVRLARREIWPDVTLGVSYGQRNLGMGTERMGSAMIGFSLPVHAGSRQLAMRAEATAMEEMARSELAAAEAALDASIGVQLAELERARTLTALYRDEIIPEARATVESAFSSYRVGSVDFMTLVDAQMTANRYEGELHQLLGDYGKAVAALESIVGRELRRTGSTPR